MHQNTPLEKVSTTQSVLDVIPEALMVIGLDHQIRLMNRAAREIYLDKAPCISGRPLFCYQVTHHHDNPCSDEEGHPCPFTKVLKTKKTCTVVHRHLDMDGREITFEIQAAPLLDERGEICGIVETCRDITDRLALEDEKMRLRERRFREQREESIRRLAAGIAHDFNNILTSIMGNAEMIRLGIGSYPPAELADVIIRESQRMAGLTRQLLAYSGSGMCRMKELLPNALISDALERSQKGEAANIEIILDLTSDLWPVLGDYDQLGQALISIFDNAFEAMAGAGRLTVQSANTVKSESWQCRYHDRHAAGYYVDIQITDNGPGLKEGIKDRLFEPFVSDKFLGRGLGLAAAYGIIKHHDGCMWAEDSPAGGAVFHILLPRAGGAGPHPVMQKIEKTVGGADWIKDKEILVVDDEPEVIKVLRNILLTNGARVNTAENGVQALTALKNRPGIRMVILDIQMPGMSGKEVYRRIKDLNPDIRVLLSSGYEKDNALRDISLVDKDLFIQKPYVSDDLLAKIKETMDG